MPTIPQNTRMRPLVRVLYRKWSSSSAGTGQWSAWSPLPMSQRLGSRTATNGFLVDMWSRYCLPMIGQARLRYRTGRINGVNYFGTDDLGNPIPVDLNKAEIRIQVAPSPLFEAPRETVKNWSPAWKTAWMGTVEQIETKGTSGETIYHCFDGFYRAKRWQMVSHHMYFNGQSYKGRGHPGYNASVEGFYARVQGNKDPGSNIDDPMGDITSSGLPNHNFAFTWPALGSGSLAEKWTDKQAVESACQGSRGRGEPVFEVRGQTGLLASSSAWPVVKGMRCWDFVAMICDRRRGRGLTFFDWEDDSGDASGPLDVCLRIRSPFSDDISFTPPGTSTTITLPGANLAGTTMDLDYSGDHRLIPGSVCLGDRLAYRMDYVESSGEPIEVLTTLSGADGSLEGRYTTADAAAFLAVTNPRWRSTSRWDPIYQRFGVPTNWTWLAKDGNNSNPSRCDYLCDDDGLIIIPMTGNDVLDPYASPLVMRLLDDLPLYEGYDYTTSTPVRYDGSKDPTAPPRRPVMAFIQTTGDKFLDVTRMGIGASLQVDPQFGVLVKIAENQSEYNAGRFFSATGVPGYAYNWQKLVLTVGLRLGNCVRMADGDPRSPRRLFIEHPGLHLWLAHPGAIWELNRASSDVAEAPALRAAAGANAIDPGILRDDRASLAALHQLAKIWYLQDHRTASLALRDCIDLPSYADADGASYTYPTLGTLITSLSFTDATRTTQTATLDTPVTGYIFDNVKCRSDVSTDWSDLDFVNR